MNVRGSRERPLRSRRIVRTTALVALGLALAAAGCSERPGEDVDNAGGSVSAEGDLSGHYTGLWTNWWREEFDLEKKKANGLLKLLKMREALGRDNLVDTYGPNGADLGKTPSCTGDALTRRTLDGTCNDLKRPMAGAAGARMGRNTDLKKVVAESESSILSPNPRQISVELLSRESVGGAAKVKEVDFLNLSAASWIQFQNHDWFAHAQQTTQTFKVSFEGENFFIPKSVEDPHDDLSGFPLLKTYKSEVTHWWDGSQLYGSDAATAKRLRSKDGKLVEGGVLFLDENGNLPVVHGTEDSGFTKNWWLGLSMMHTLFAREHNAIAKELKAKHPEFSDDKVFDVARMINAAVMAKIHTVEWTPAILKNRALAAGMHANWCA